MTTKGYNKTIIIGRLGADPEFRSGEKSDIANFSICNSTFDKDGNEDVQWHRIKAFGRQALLCRDHLRKGDLCCIEGRLDVHAYEKNGERRVANSIIVEKLTFLTPKRRPESDSSGTETSDIDSVFAG